MQRKSIAIIEKSRLNKTLRAYVDTKYGELYDVEGIPATLCSMWLEGLAPEHTSLVIVPGFNIHGWEPSARTKNKLVDYVETGGNMLLVCDAFNLFMNKGHVLARADWTRKLKESQERKCGEYLKNAPDDEIVATPFDTDCLGNYRLPDTLSIIKFAGDEKDRDYLAADTEIGAYALDDGKFVAPESKDTMLYHASGLYLSIKQNYDQSRILPLAKVKESSSTHPYRYMEPERRRVLFSMVYVRQGAGNILLSSDHNEEYLPDFLKAAEENLDIPAAVLSGFNEDLRRFMYEEILGLENPRGAMPADEFDPSLAIIKEKIGLMRG